MDPGAIASLLQHPINSALLVLDADGHALAANPAAQALALPQAVALYAPLLQDLRRGLDSEARNAVACSLPGPGRRLDGWLRAVRAPDGGVLAYTLSVPDPEGASRWQVALDSAGHGLWDWDIASNRIFRSETWLAMLGHTADTVSEYGLEAALALVHPDDVVRVRDSIRLHLEGRTDSYACEHRLRHRDGSWRWVRDSGRVVAWSADGRPLRMVGTHTGIDEQKQLETRLREQQALLEEIQRLAGMAPFSWDPYEDSGWWSRDLYRMTGHAPRNRDSARAWLRRLPRSAVAELRKSWRRMRSDGQPLRFEVGIHDHRGDPLQLQVWARPQLDDGGRIVRVLGQVQDVTAQRRADALLSWRNELLNRISALGHIGGCEIEPGTRRMQWTEECYRIHGLPPGPVTLDEALALYTRESREAFEQALARLAEGATPEQLELCFYRRSGQRVWVQVLIELDTRVGLPARIVALYRDITHERETSERIELLSHYDLLTGLPNRFLLREQAEQAIEGSASGEEIALLLVDLDGFKTINDTYGHAAGDAILKAVAGRLHHSLGVNDLFGRLGGDEFMVMLRGPMSPGVAADSARRLVEALTEPLQFGNETLRVGASVGIAMLASDGPGFDDLLRAAHAALRAARELGRNTVQLHNEEIRRHTRRRLEIEHALRGALEREEFSLVYQPQIAIRDDHPPGIEALVRWQHPGLGACHPGEFVPIAEHCGEIVRLGEWVIAEACRQAVAWHAAGLEFGRIAINVSGVQLRDRGFAERVVSLCQRAGWPPSRLELELTESALILDSDNLRHCFQVFERHGVQLAVDDFGTGFSNLHYLNRFPVQRLKIDRSFVVDMLRDTCAGEVTQAIIHLGHALGMRVVAEGVETSAEHAQLKLWGCDEVQGYVHTRPLPPRELAQWLRARDDRPAVRTPQIRDARRTP
ncbi:EAL domain-containing protein [Xanthomonas sp. XNM01]|uniref:EAL domain-containing protein n=1 Tax=Xanthomonas sp. XNM01 TaxID=2769289 RepID=UPI001786B73F|nr:EAL domain-containing protein [Xanthomonas sp. XNM01]